MVISLPEQAEYGNTKSRIAVSSFRTDTTSLKWRSEEMDRDEMKKRKVQIKQVRCEERREIEEIKVKEKIEIRSQINVKKNTRPHIHTHTCKAAK